MNTIKFYEMLSILLIVFLNSNGQEKQTVAGEDFDSFLIIFATDIQFQSERIKFPLEYGYEMFKEDVKVEERIKKITKEDWKHDVLFMEENFRPQVYDNFKGEMRDTDERLFVWKGISNGVTEKLYFSRINGNWFLIKKERIEVK